MINYWFLCVFKILPFSYLHYYFISYLHPFVLIHPRIMAWWWLTQWTWMPMALFCLYVALHHVWCSFKADFLGFSELSFSIPLQSLACPITNAGPLPLFLQCTVSGKAQNATHLSRSGGRSFCLWRKERCSGEWLTGLFWWSSKCLPKH